MCQQLDLEEITQSCSDLLYLDTLCYWVRITRMSNYSALKMWTTKAFFLFQNFHGNERQHWIQRVIRRGSGHVLCSYLDGGRPHWPIVFNF